MRRRLHATCNHFGRASTGMERRFQKATVAGGVVFHLTTVTVRPCWKACRAPCQHEAPDPCIVDQWSRSPCLDWAAGHKGRASGSLGNLPDPSQSEDRAVQSHNFGEPVVRSIPARSRWTKVAVRPTRTVVGPSRTGRKPLRRNSYPPAGQAFSNTSASATSGSMPATILALILTALTALVAPVWRMMAMISSTTAR